MNYHLMVAEKFVDDFITEAERSGTDNQYLIIGYTKKSPVFVKHPKAFYVKDHEEYLKDLAHRIKTTDKVFIHWLWEVSGKFIMSLPKEVQVGLFFWGGDILDDRE